MTSIGAPEDWRERIGEFSQKNRNHYEKTYHIPLPAELGSYIVHNGDEYPLNAALITTKHVAVGNQDHKQWAVARQLHWVDNLEAKWFAVIGKFLVVLAKGLHPIAVSIKDSYTSQSTKTYNTLNAVADADPIEAELVNYHSAFSKKTVDWSDRVGPLSQASASFGKTHVFTLPGRFSDHTVSHAGHKQQVDTVLLTPEKIAIGNAQHNVWAIVSDNPVNNCGEIASCSLFDQTIVFTLAWSENNYVMTCPLERDYVGQAKAPPAPPNHTLRNVALVAALVGLGFIAFRRVALWRRGSLPAAIPVQSR